MLVLRYAAVLAIAAWTGGLLALGAIVAPAIFDVVALRHVAEGRVLSGAIFGEALRRFHLVTYGCGGVLLLALVDPRRARSAPAPILGALRPRHADARGDALLRPRPLEPIEQVQQEVGPGVAPSSLAQGSAAGRVRPAARAVDLDPARAGAVVARRRAAHLLGAHAELEKP